MVQKYHLECRSMLVTGFEFNKISPDMTVRYAYFGRGPTETCCLIFYSRSACSIGIQKELEQDLMYALDVSIFSNTHSCWFACPFSAILLTQIHYGKDRVPWHRGILLVTFLSFDGLRMRGTALSNPLTRPDIV
ncbi:hypothetical protein BYT27DRAFT_6530022 [Phlegmacium glaucopus]|nr:hypothetical protein BYT27DRAFT_6530022 [Phlegmacium glaucopus]